MTLFSEKYNRLNTEQKEAVDTLYGPVLVIAGPGSGKTELLAVRIANILKKTDANPNNILCLTFTENAANNMRERLAKIIGPEAYKVSIHTFHTFGLEILNRFRHKIRENEELTTVDDIESAKILHTINNKLPWDSHWKGEYRTNTIKETITRLKEASLTVKDLESVLTLNEQILNIIGPKIEKQCEKIFSLGNKKAEKIEKIALFEKMRQSIETEKDQGKNYHLIENLGNIIYKSIQDALGDIDGETDAKPLTKWKNNWLTKTSNGWRLKEIEKHEKVKQFLDIYKEYESYLQANSMIDFSDMILRALRLVNEDFDVQASLAEQYQWILVDEYQDTNDAQFSLISSILEPAGDSPNIFAVGDDDQSIYKFQGANIRNIELFLRRYHDTKTIILKENYRSHKEIIDLSCSLTQELSTNISDLLPEVKKEFNAFQGKGANIEYNLYENEIDEIVGVAEDIEKKIKENVAPKDIAVIAKKNATLESIAKILIKKNIPVSVSQTENIFENPVVMILIDMLEYIYSLQTQNPRDDLLVRILSHPMWQINRLTLWEISQKIYKAKKEENKNWIEVLRHHSDKYISKIAHFFIEITLISSHTRLEKIIDFLTGVNQLQISDDYEDNEKERQQSTLFLEEINENFTSPLYEYFFGQEKLKETPAIYITHLLSIQKCTRSIKAIIKNGDFLRIEDFVEYLQIIRKYNIKIPMSMLIENPDAVQCITAHKAKGLEYDYVYAISMIESEYTRGRNNANVMPANISILPEKDNIDDIIRLTYTIFTRAKKFLSISYAKKKINEKPNSLLSVLANIPEEKWTNIKGKLSENEIYLVENLENDIFDTNFSVQENMFLKNYIKSGLSISATALQNFLDVTSGGPKHFLSNNILRFPEAKNQHAVYGTAIHKGLEDFFKDYKFHGTYNKKILLKSFEERLEKDGLIQIITAELLARGKENLEYFGY
ncbi:ATP-dependent helicase [Candidatus Gracilibacteria bacterium]|nr:ATP-dependent helicase [Candidatus Gracilibacteria bacterium]